MKSDAHVTQGIEEQCDETFVLANVEEVVNENGASEDEQTSQTSNVPLGNAQDEPEYKSDEDVEVDIDGSDNEELPGIIIPHHFLKHIEDNHFTSSLVSHVHH